VSAGEHPQAALAYYDSLTAAERRSVDEHLAACGECRDLLGQYRRQDAALAQIPRLRPRLRGWHSRQPAPVPRWLGWLGNGLALGGLGALAGAVALQLRHQANLAAASAAGVPGDLAAEPGLTLPPRVVELPSPWLPALPWIGLALLAVGVLFVLSRGRGWPALAGAVLAAVLLTGYVPPLSGLPNPAGIAWRLVGGYQYDPNLPFKNDFVIAGRPEQLLRAHLDGLIGAVGLSPLDPNQPLARYEVLKVGLHPQHADVALVTTRFVYADGSSRVYPVPLADPLPSFDGFWWHGWRNDGLQRLRSIHVALPGQPFATDEAAIRLGAAKYLDTLDASAQRLDEANPFHWFWDSVRLQRLVWSPDGTAFLARVEVEAGQYALWAVPLDGAAPRQVATGQVQAYGWSPDGQYVVYTVVDPAAAQVDFTARFAITAAPLDPSRGQARQLATSLESSDLPGLTAEGAWFFSDGAAWIAPYDGSTTQLAVSGLASYRPRGAPRPAPHNNRLAFGCGGELCLLPDLLRQIGGPAAAVQEIPIASVAELAWSHDGAQLAVISRDPNGLLAVTLFVVDANGAIVREAEVAPRDATDTPQWTHDGGAILVQTYPQDGRRIIAVDLDSGAVLDLSKEHWDTYFALAPDGQSLLLNNGRGGFWMAPLLRRHP
jgi:hypothetical protein